MANFPSCSHHAIRKEVRPPKNFSLGRIHWSRFEFGALGLVLIISPSSELGIMHHFFLWTPYSSRNILPKFQFFSQSARPVPKKFQFRQNSLKQVWIRSTWDSFDHISLIRPWNHLLCFLIDSLFFKKHSVKIWKIFSTDSTGWHPAWPIGIRLDRLASGSIGWHPARPVGIRFNRFIESTCMEHWFWWFWSPIPTWLGPMGSRSVLGCILDPFWVFFRIPCSPPWIHMDPWWGSKLKA